MNQEIIFNLRGESTGLRKAASTGQLALSNLNQSILNVAQSNSRLALSGKQLRDEQGRFVGVVQQARAAAAQLTAEKQRLAAVNKILENSLKKEELAILRSTGALTSMRGAAGSADFALLSLTQGIQDAGNFGMGMAQGVRAVNNNLQAFVTSLTFAAQANGGLGATFAKMGASLLGPAGLLFAFSAVSAAIEFFSNKSQQAKKDADDATRALSNLVEVVDPTAFARGAVTTEKLKDRISELTKESEALNDETELVATNYGFYRRQTDDAKKAQEKLNDEIAALEKLLPDVAGELIKYLSFIGSADNLQARALDSAVDLTEQIAKMKVELRLAGAFDFALLEIKRLKNQISLIEFPREFREGILDMETGISLLRAELGLLQSAEGDRLSALELQTEELEKQIERAKARNRLEQRGLIQPATSVDAAGLDPLSRGTKKDDELAAFAGPKRLFVPGALSDIIEDQERFAKISIEQERLNQQMSESFARLGADLITSFATIGGGFDLFTQQIGRFMGRLGKQMIQIGLTTKAFGVAMQAFKAALKGNPIVAIAAGAALVAIGSRLANQASNAANNPGQNDGVGAGRDFTAPGFPGVPDFGFSFPSAASIPSVANAGVGSSPQLRIVGTLTGSGRELVAVIDSEVNAQQALGVRAPLRIG